eukprot:6177399-Pleurochrysis_carterae.AAC.5
MTCPLLPVLVCAVGTDAGCDAERRSARLACCRLARHRRGGEDCVRLAVQQHLLGERQLLRRRPHAELTRARERLCETDGPVDAPDKRAVAARVALLYRNVLKHGNMRNVEEADDRRTGQLIG